MLYLLILFFLFSTPLLAKNNLDDFTADVEKVYGYYGEENYAEAVKLFSRLYYLVANKDIKQNLAIHNALSYRRLNDIVKSDQWFKISLKLSKDISDKASKILITSQLAENRKIEKDYSNAILLYEEVLSYDFLTTDDLLVVKYKLGLSYFYQNNYDEALFYFKESFELSNKLNLYYIQASSSLIMGYIYQCIGNHNESMLYYRRSYDISIVKGYYDLAIDSLFGLGYLFETVTLYRSAIADYSEALSLILEHEEYTKLDELIKRLEYLIFINPSSVDSSWVTFLDVIKSADVQDNDVKFKLDIITAYGKFYNKEYADAYSIAKELSSSIEKSKSKDNDKVDDTNDDKNIDALVSVLVLMSEINRVEKNYNEALFYAGIAIQLLDNIQDKSELVVDTGIDIDSDPATDTDFRIISISNRDVVNALYATIYLSQDKYIEARRSIKKVLSFDNKCVLKDRYRIVEKRISSDINTEKKYRVGLIKLIMERRASINIDDNITDSQKDYLDNINLLFDDKGLKDEDNTTTAEILEVFVDSKID